MKKNTSNLEVTNLFNTKFISNPYDCPVTRTMSFIGGKWKPIILFCLTKHSMRYGKLRMYIPAISSKVLTQELKELEQLGLINRQEFKELPPRVEYTLSNIGESLKPVLKVLCDWGKTTGLTLENIKSTIEDA
jgi:DNA-binding HxlR family transcriptional regulator